TTHTYVRDVLGRMTSDQVAVTSGQVDPSIQRLDTAYDTGGRPYLFTSYADTAGQMPKNQVQRSYNGLSQLTNEYQAHSGLGTTSTTAQVQYSYDVMASGNESRLVTMTYPTTSRVLTYNYNGTTLDNSISRVTSLSDSSGTLESESYLGLANVVTRSHPLQPNTRLDLTYVQPGGSADGGDQYVGLDRFGRIVDQHWLFATSTTSTDTDAS